VLHGSFSYVLQNDDGQTQNVHSISAGLDYPGVGPEHSYWKEKGRVRYENISDTEALDAYHTTARREGILPALESSHALAQAFKEARRLGSGKSWSSASPAAATKTLTRSPGCEGANLNNRIDSLFARLKNEQRRALMPFVTAGDPDWRRRPC